MDLDKRRYKMFNKTLCVMMYNDFVSGYSLEQISNRHEIAIDDVDEMLDYIMTLIGVM